MTKSHPAKTQNQRNKMLISVVVPVYNEEEVVESFYQRTKAVLDKLPCDSEILFVNDGSKDATLDILEKLGATDPMVGIIDLSRNFGKEIAMTAGLDCVEGDAVVVIDADLQDPPELIEDMFNLWQEGYDVAYGQRSTREGETFLKKFTAKVFYFLMQRSSKVFIPRDTGDFRLMSRRAVDAINSIRERHRFMKGLFAWIGYPQKAVFYRRDPRYAGKTKWNYWSLWNFAIEGITSFTEAPLKFAMYLGLATAFGSFVYGMWVIFKTLTYGDPVAGYPSLLVIILFLGGVQLVAIGIIGEYLGRTFSESKHRPLYFIKTFKPSEVSISDTVSTRKVENESDTQEK